MPGGAPPFYWCSTWTVCASAGYTRCSGCTSVYVCAASLENLAVPRDFYSSLSVPPTTCSSVLFSSHWPHIRWCGTFGFQEQGQCFFIDLNCSIQTIIFYYFPPSLLSVYRLVLWDCDLLTFWLIGCTSLSLSLAVPTPFNNNAADIYTSPTNVFCFTFKILLSRVVYTACCIGCLSVW